MSALDFLIVGAHPDDVELSAGGLMLLARAAGMRVGVIDLTRGELGTAGNPETRAGECRRATELLGLDTRENLDLGDARLEANMANREILAAAIARLQPRTLIGHLEEDLHPDHAAAGELVREAWHLAGLQKLLDKISPGAKAHRPSLLLRFAPALPAKSTEPALILDISVVFEAKMDVIGCYSSQMKSPGSGDRDEHFASNLDILERSEINARYWGSQIGVPYGEPLYHPGPLPADLIGLVRP